ncbi:protein argonaute-2-like [Homarus americanus]|uniref:protein argonaute-2-like n=1 Tax=Homarus americanus TaxID=6706 RepID=UPI001C450231|nr:protein argonaute-2-like [Homarus americanus]
MYCTLLLDPKPPPRTDVGSKGLKINLETNYFPISVKNKFAELVHYEVSLKKHNKDANLPRKTKMEIFEKMKMIYEKDFKNYPLAYDSERNAYSVGVIPALQTPDCQSTYEIDLEESDGKRTQYKISLMVRHRANLQELTEALNCSAREQKTLPLNIFQMVEVMFRHYRAIKYELVGRRNFYSAGGEFGTPYPIGCGKEGVTGFFGSMRPASWKDGSLLLNIDVAHTAFYKEQPLLNFIQDFMNFREDDFHRPLEPFKRSKLLQELRNIRVQVTHSNIPRTYKIIDVSEHSAEKQTFPLKDENTGNTVYCTIENYFKNQYGKKIKFPKLNCVQVSPAERNVFIPFEGPFCFC